MAEESKIVLSSEDKSLGTIQISPRVLEIIAGIAASEIDGVSKMYGSFANSVSELLGRSDRRRGVKLSSNDEKLSLDVDVYVEYGVSVPKVAAMIQDKVKQQITLMTDLKVKEVNVHIKGIVTSKEDQQVDPNDLFGEHFNDEAGE
ncbi:Asp23/Gls24 family envelope stress response protein [Limosilactobacillus reuteri]|uniref:Asp23/Gls24 family envelope stress response protein n=1 Tax=Limosilactobacillus reuteri TaxID=1598 RepID=UPI00080C4C15|nr:Asp23/Gls24 family envelope stress response protein [Limosilactobacillus reuteri]ANU51529.1 alkaline-shock protein [Limosilactobacillus reuteri]OXE60743.1 Asp23/Gls24 family envelope stress response protein [Limosilactobacillus reuteri]QQR14510.1 Asp23/Gls24 family envelope stress response protein [Limosilactobacillus reuteri]